MKEQLIFRLNQLIKKPVENITEIVQLLITFEQRSENNPDLINNAKAVSDFTIKDIKEIQKKLLEHKKLIDRMSSLLKKQEKKLEKMDFNDSVEVNFDEKFVETALNLLGKDKIVAISNDSSLINSFPELWLKENLIIVENQFTKDFFEILKKQELFKITIYLSEIKVQIINGVAKCFASHSKLFDLKKLEVQK
jgi:ABC-type Fe3+-citrate transport system substrate-binding protein